MLGKAVKNIVLGKEANNIVMGRKVSTSITTLNYQIRNALMDQKDEGPNAFPVQKLNGDWDVKLISGTCYINGKEKKAGDTFLLHELLD